MSEMQASLSEEELLQEVRDALAGLDSSKVPDSTIKQTKTRFVEPLLNDLVTNPDQDNFDNAVIAWTAEKAFDAWLAFERIRDSGMEAYVRPAQYRERLEKRTDNALFIMGATRPPDTPNTVVTVKHDGKERRVNLDR